MASSQRVSQEVERFLWHTADACLLLVHFQFQLLHHLCHLRLCLLVIRPHEAEDILAMAEERCRKEAAMMDELRGGRTTMDLLGLDERPNGD